MSNNSFGLIDCGWGAVGNKILCVAEKPSVAKEISRIMSDGTFSYLETMSKYNPVMSYRYDHAQVHFTSVLGHIKTTAFPYSYSNWQTTDTSALFQAEIIRLPTPTSVPVIRNLEKCARDSTHLCLWLDCDTEGENIAFEVLDVCLNINPRLKVSRAVFSTLAPSDIQHALANLRLPDKNLSDAVETRQEIDLRLGSIFTRILTLKFKFKLNPQPKVISYGPCQLPTLGFVVSRYLDRRNFIPEEFFKLVLKGKHIFNSKTSAIEFSWKRGNLFDQHVVEAFAAKCMHFVYSSNNLYNSNLYSYNLNNNNLNNNTSNNNRVNITNVVGRPVYKKKPLPLSTVEMQKAINIIYGMPSARCMEIAEKLYSRGIISYPRTETEIYSPSTDLQNLMIIHTNHSVWGEYTKHKLIDGNGYEHPRAGRHDDKAHPPVHPVRSVEKMELNSHEEWQIYEYVTRRFLGSCSKDAMGKETIATVDVAGETFTTSGLIIHEKNFLEVFEYQKWNAKIIPFLQIGDEIHDPIINVDKGTTTAPQLLSEAELLQAMNVAKIGTDATMHEHIKTIQERSYAFLNSFKKFEPTGLGVAVVEAFQLLAEPCGGLDLGKPALRSKMEADMALISAGRKSKAEVLQDTLQKMKRFCQKMQQNLPIMEDTFAQHLGNAFAKSRFTL